MPPLFCGFVTSIFAFDASDLLSDGKKVKMKKYEDSKKQDTYTYMWVDGSTTTIVAGQDGVTKEFIELLHEMDREGINAERREKRKAPKYIEDVFGEDSNSDKNNLLRDSRYDPAEMLHAMVDAGEHERQLVKLHEAMKALSEKQRETIKKLFFEGKSLVEIAVEDGVSETAVRQRRDAAIKNLKNF